MAGDPGSEESFIYMATWTTATHTPSHISFLFQLPCFTYHTSHPSCDYNNQNTYWEVHSTELRCYMPNS